MGRPVTYEELDRIEEAYGPSSVAVARSAIMLSGEVRRLNDRIDTLTAELYRAQEALKEARRDAESPSGG